VSDNDASDASQPRRLRHKTLIREPVKYATTYLQPLRMVVVFICVTCWACEMWLACQRSSLKPTLIWHDAPSVGHFIFHYNQSLKP